jgi:hypothetical protein
LNLTAKILALAALLALGATMLGNATWRRRKAERELHEAVHGADRFVDMGVALRVVRADENGEELLEGKPKVVVLREHRFGGMVDTQASQPFFCGPSTSPVIWYCSEDQEPIVLHGDDLPLGLLVYGSEGAGKTTALAQWHFIRVLEHLGEGREGGQTAPTEPRLEMVRAEMFRLYPSTWFKYRASEGVVRFVDGTQIRLVSTYRQSEAQGSRVQGFSWSWCGRDEAQDQIDAHEDIESRGRAARDGKYKQLGTCTAKDNPRWRTFRDVLLKSGQWLKLTLLAERSPFVAKAFWAAKKATMSAREWARRGLALDVAPERATYPAWSREGNLRARPQLGLRNITSQVIRAKTGEQQHVILVGYDPGSYKQAAIFLSAYEFEQPRQRWLDVPAGEPLWWVRAELYRKGMTTEAFGQELLAMARNVYGVNRRPDGERMHVRADPYGKSLKHPDKDVYKIFDRLGISIKSAQYSKQGTGNGQVPQESRIEMVNRLLCSATGMRRLFIDVDEFGRPVAPKLVESIEGSERDEAGNAETERKDETDLSDCPSALGLALWPFEKESATALRAEIKKEMG